LSRKARRQAVAAGLLWLIFGSWLWLETATVERELAASRTKCAELQVPLHASAYLEKYYGGNAPDTDFTALVKRYQAENESFSILDCDAENDLLDPPEKRRERRDFLNSDLAKGYFPVIDRLSASGQIFRYQLEPNGLILDWKLPHLRIYREVARSYQWRILDDAERGNRAGPCGFCGSLHKFRKLRFEATASSAHWSPSFANRYGSTPLHD